ncbi:MAG: pepsin-like aspartyl protease [Candidatus Pacebacteria bacterium]|nr:pepsin-like aspartyl protease [Candidatus Paceibacterota bacterium]
MSYKGRKVALLSVVPSKRNDYVLLGTNFLRNYFTVFDCELFRIGIMKY